MGGQPEQTSGVWGAFVRALEGSAKALGIPAALSLLEEGEDHGKAMYQQAYPKLSKQQQGFVRDVIYPEQVKSHDILIAIEKNL